MIIKEGITHTIKEFSEDFNNLYNTWKYIIEEYDDGINIKYMEKKDNEWVKVNDININSSCAYRLFKEIADAFENGEFV